MTSSANAACRIQRRERIVSDATTFGLYERAAPNEASVASVSHPLVLAGALAVAGLGWLLLRAPHRAGRPLIALVLVTAGAVGNYLDRIFRGYVVDFVHLKHWPVFNVADVYITLGYVVFAGVLLARWRRGEVAGGG